MQRKEQKKIGNFVPGIVQGLVFQYLAASGSRKVDREKRRAKEQLFRKRKKTNVEFLSAL